MKIIILLLTINTLASAFPAKLKWNRNPEPDILEYRVWQIMPDGTKVLRQTVLPASNALTTDKIVSQSIEMESGQVYTVTAFNGFESEPADPYTIPAKPVKPSNLEVVEIQVSSNLKDWETIALVPSRTKDPVRFVRAGIATITQP